MKGKENFVLYDNDSQIIVSIGNRNKLLLQSIVLNLAFTNIHQDGIKSNLRIIDLDKILNRYEIQANVSDIIAANYEYNSFFGIFMNCIDKKAPKKEVVDVLNNFGINAEGDNYVIQN